MENMKKNLIDSYRKEIIERVPEMREKTMNASDSAIEAAYLMLKLSEKDRDIFVNHLNNR